MQQLFADLLGQPRAVSLLTAALQQRRLAPAYLFAGPDGVGRRLAALRFLEGVISLASEELKAQAGLRRRLQLRNHPDLLWVEPTYQHQGRLVRASEAELEGVSRRTAPQIRLEQVRELARFLARHPVEAPGPMVVLESVEAMAEGAANALLKTLEEPGAGVLLLISAAPEQLLSTIRSRCQQIPFVRLAPAQVQIVLEGLPEAGALAQVDPDDPAELLELAAGSPGALLEQRRRWRELPEGLAGRMLDLRPDPMEALALARDLCEALDGEQQQWLLNWWQLALWRRRGPMVDLRRLERLRSQLRAHVSPRLAWEVALLQLGGCLE